MSAVPDARAMVRALKGRWSGKSGVCRCPAHEDGTPSLSVSETRDGRALVHCFAGCPQEAVIGALKAAGLWSDGPVMRDPSYPKHLTVPHDGGPSRDERGRREAARAIWSVARPIAGTLGERYLRARGIAVPLPPTLRFAEIKHPADGMIKPAVICAIQDSRNKVTAVQRIFLRPDGMNKTHVRPEKPVLGPMGGGAARMGPAGRVMGLAEGPETALSAQQIFSLPVWCSCGAARMKRTAFPRDVKTVYIFADAGKPGMDAAVETAEGLPWDLEPPEAQTLWRAAKRAGIAERLFDAESSFAGYPWYDALPRIESFSVHVQIDGEEYTFDDLPDTRGGRADPRPDSIRLDLKIARESRSEAETLPADLIFGGRDGSWIDDARPLVTKDSDLTPDELAALIVDAFFSPSDDVEADSYQTQREQAEALALRMAAEILLSGDAALERAIADIARRDILWLVPRGRAMDIAIREGKMKVELEPQNPPPA